MPPRDGVASGSAGVFVDAVSAKHVSSSPADLLAQRQLTWNKHYGWTYDVWIDNPARYALTGANSRFSLPAVFQRVGLLVQEGMSGAWQAVQRHLPQQQQQQQQKPLE